jgi:hypothetical protein
MQRKGQYHTWTCCAAGFRPGYVGSGSKACITGSATLLSAQPQRDNLTSTQQTKCKHSGSVTATPHHNDKVALRLEFARSEAVGP